MTTGDEVQLVSFRVAGRELALNVFQVERILRYEKPAPLPGAPDFLEGMVRYADEVVPVVDLRKRLGADAPVDDDTRIMVANLDGSLVGLVVDAVLDVAKVPADRITAPPEVVKGLAADYITGIVALDDKTIVLLAASKLLTSSERIALDELEVGAVDD